MAIDHESQLVVHEIPGTHLTMIEDVGAAELARSLRCCLENVAVERQPVESRLASTHSVSIQLPAVAFQRSAIRR